MLNILLNANIKTSKILYYKTYIELARKNMTILINVKVQET